MTINAIVCYKLYSHQLENSGKMQYKWFVWLIKFVMLSMDNSGSCILHHLNSIHLDLLFTRIKFPTQYDHCYDDASPYTHTLRGISWKKEIICSTVRWHNRKWSNILFVWEIERERKKNIEQIYGYIPTGTLRWCE